MITGTENPTSKTAQKQPKNSPRKAQNYMNISPNYICGIN
jgi:hypothetical protein